MDEEKIIYFTVVCPCQTELEIDEGTIKTCPNCGREIDDKGLEVY